MMPLPQLWAVFFFVMIILLGLDSQVCQRLFRIWKMVLGNPVACKKKSLLVFSNTWVNFPRTKASPRQSLLRWPAPVFRKRVLAYQVLEISPWCCHKDLCFFIDRLKIDIKWDFFSRTCDRVHRRGPALLCSLWQITVTILLLALQKCADWFMLSDVLVCRFGSSHHCDFRLEPVLLPRRPSA